MNSVWSQSKCLAQYNVQVYSRPDKAQVVALLTANQLPTADVSELDFEHFLGCGTRDHPSGVVGLELFTPDALLRSLVVDEHARGSGCGKVLVDAIEQYAQRLRLRNLYLLTETAERFFSQLDYRRIERESVPESIQQCREFSELCPDSAVVMVKRLNSSG